MRRSPDATRETISCMTDSVSAKLTLPLKWAWVGGIALALLSGYTDLATQISVTPTLRSGASPRQLAREGRLANGLTNRRRFRYPSERQDRLLPPYTRSQLG